MVGKKTAGALVLAAVALVLGVGTAAAAEDNREMGTDGTRVTSEQPDGKDQ